MRKTKTIMSGLLVGAMIFGLAACSQSGSTTQSSVAASIDTESAKQELEQKEEAATTAAAPTWNGSRSAAKAR